MAFVDWEIDGREFASCNCDYGCPCQFNALPTHGNCEAVVGIQIDSGHFGETDLGGTRAAAVMSWPGPIHEGDGEALIYVDESASEAQRQALLTILSGQETEPGATIFNVFAATLAKVHDPIFQAIDLQIDVDGRSGKLSIDGQVNSEGRPIVNPATGAEHRVRIDLPKGFEYVIAEVGSGTAKTSGPLKIETKDSHAHFARLHMTPNGVVH